MASEVNVPETCRRAAEIVRRAWGTGAFAKGPDGRPVSVVDPEAVTWCAKGAIYRALADQGHQGNLGDLGKAVEDHVLGFLPGERYLSGWNDQYGRTAKQVATVLDKAAGAPTF